jgi:hypothetical protein
MDDKERCCEDFAVPAHDLKCLNANRHLKMSVVAAYCRLLVKHYKEHALAPFIPAEQRPNLWIIDPGCLDIHLEVMLCHFVSVSPFLQWSSRSDHALGRGNCSS